MDKIYHYIGGQGGGGMGYGAPAAVGAALANRKHGRISINIQTDGDLNYAPAVLWSAAHHRIPLLTIMHNNRGYRQELMYVEQQCSQRNRGADRAHIGTKLFILSLSVALPQSGDAKKGKDLYLKYSCYSCHSFDGHGGAGARLVPMKMPVIAFTAYVRNPRQMPPYSLKVMPDAELADVWAYLRTIPDSPAAKDIPLLRQATG